MSRIDWSRARVLVAGGGGFLGSHVVRRLEARGCVPVVPRTADGWDLRKEATATELAERYRPEVVIDCAADQGGLAYVRRAPATIFTDNLLMGLHLMRAATAAGAHTYVSALAACSYPGETTGPMREEDYWAGPLHESVVAYGFTKKARVVQAQCYARQHGLRAISLLLANLYGPGDHLEPERSHALTALLRRFGEAVRDGRDEVVVWGSGDPIREWLYVDDAAEALVIAAERIDSVEPFNVGTGVGLSVRELAERIASAVGFTGRVVYDRSHPDGAPFKTLCVDRFTTATGWRARTSLDEGLARSLEWLRRRSTSAPGRGTR